MSQVKLLHGYPDYIGKRFAWAGDYTGPSSYVTGGDPVTLPGFGEYIDSVGGNYLTNDGSYLIRAVASQTGARATFKFKWYPIATPGTEVSANTNLSAEIARISGFGGVY